MNTFRSRISNMLFVVGYLTRKKIVSIFVSPLAMPRQYPHFAQGGRWFIRQPFGYGGLITRQFGGERRLVRYRRRYTRVNQSEIDYRRSLRSVRAGINRLSEYRRRNNPAYRHAAGVSSAPLRRPRTIATFTGDLQPSTQRSLTRNALRSRSKFTSTVATGAGNLAAVAAATEIARFGYKGLSWSYNAFKRKYQGKKVKAPSWTQFF